MGKCRSSCITGHDQIYYPPPTTKLRPYRRTCEKETVCAPVGQSCTSGPDRPLSQLLPDLQLNQHGFSRAWCFSSATKKQRSHQSRKLQPIRLNRSMLLCCLQPRRRSVKSKVTATAKPGELRSRLHR